MAAAMWKEKLELSECIESARNKMRAARKFQAKGRADIAAVARRMASSNMERARFLKNKIDTFRQIILRTR